MTARKPVRQYAFEGRAGCVWRKQNHKTRTTVGLYHNAQAGLSTEGGDWSTVCEDHGRTAVHKTLTEAKSSAPDPHEWCEMCAKSGSAS